MCNVLFSVVCLVCSGVVFLCCGSEQGGDAECGAGRNELRSPEPEASPAFKCK